MKPKQSDDLITRLEQEARRIQLDELGKVVGGTGLVHPSPLANLLQEAANEIKALQAEKDLLKSDFEGLWEAYEAIGYERRERS